MKKNNLILLILIILSRITDLSTTFIAGNGSLIGEKNLLVTDFKLGWNSMLFANLIIIFIFSISLKFNTNKYYATAEKRVLTYNKEEISDFGSYFSFIYFKKKISLFKSLFYTKTDYKLLINSMIVPFAVTTIILGFIISINNLLNGFGLINIFSINNKFYQNNIIKLINLIIFIIVGYIYHVNKYDKFKLKILHKA